MLPRGRQSQQPARVSRANPLARGTVSLLNFGIKGVPDGVNGRLSTVVGTRTGVLRTGTRATGFGATSGAGTTDSVTSTLTAHATLRTYIAAVYVTGANSSGSLGRIFDKRTAAVATQVEVLFADQNTAATNNFNFARLHSVSQGAWSTPIGAVAPNTLQIVHVVYDSGSTANDPAIYINGGAQVVTEITAPVGTPTNNAAAYVWGNRTDDNARCLPGFILFGQVLDRLMSADEVADSTRDLWQMFAPVAQSLRTNVPAGGSHPSTGALSAQAATVAGTAVHLTLHTSTGALAAQAATVAGTAAHQHKATGALAAQAATVAGSAAHLTLHTSSGALAAQAATVAGSADHAAPGVHDAAGALAAQAATVTGTATHLTLHTSTGALAAQAATVAGTAVHNSARTSSGALVAQAATVSGQAQIGAGTPFDHDWWLKQWRKKKPEPTTTYQSPEELQTEVAPVVRQVVKQAARSKAPEWNPARLDSLTAQLNVTQKLVAAIKQQLDEEDDETVLLLL